MFHFRKLFLHAYVLLILESFIFYILSRLCKAGPFEKSRQYFICVLMICFIYLFSYDPLSNILLHYNEFTANLAYDNVCQPYL